MINPDQLLTPEESAQVDGALMTNKEKFGTRVAIYSLRVLKQISAQKGMAAQEVSTVDLHEFVESQEQLISATGMMVDATFKDFWSNLVLSSRKQLGQVAAAHQKGLGDVTVGEAIAWFEAKSKELHAP